MAGFEPAISCSRSTWNPKLSHTPLKSTQPESNRHFLHGKQIGIRYIMGALSDFRLSKIESTGRDSNPRNRITGAVSSPLDDQCEQIDKTRMGPEGLEPSPTWLRARRSATRALVP